MPPQLAGNAALASALQNPERAFQTTSQRIKVYWAWADSLKNHEKAGLAIWLRRRIAEVCGRLAEMGLPARMNDAGRAQLFLGYLGEATSKEKTA